MSSSSKEQDITQTLSTAAKNVQAVAKPVFEAIVFMIPIVIRVTKITYETYIKLPQNAILFIYGSVFCFFGGAFPTVFAAIQAAEHGGRTTVVQALQDLADEATYIIEESKKDDDANETKDNNSQTLSKEYVERKTKLVLRKMNPEKVDKALSSIYAVWISVIAVLSIQFARTISMSLSIADFLKKPLDRYVTPFATKVCPTEYAKWIPVVMSWIGKTIGMMIAWYIQTIVSAFSSALQGGLMMANATYRFCLQRNIDLFGLIKPDAKDSFVDEGFSYLFATIGFYTQFRFGFQVPFPFNVVLFPVSMMEYYIKWSITKE